MILAVTRTHADLGVMPSAPGESAVRVRVDSRNTAQPAEVPAAIATLKSTAAVNLQSVPLKCIVTTERRVTEIKPTASLENVKDTTTSVSTTSPVVSIWSLLVNRALGIITMAT